MSVDRDWVVSPGEILREWMQENGFSERRTAISSGLDLRDIQGLLSGRVAITKAVAGHLEQGTQIPAKLWLNLERAYREGLAAGKIDTSGAQNG